MLQILKRVNNQEPDVVFQINAYALYSG